MRPVRADGEVSKIGRRGPECREASGARRRGERGATVTAAKADCYFNGKFVNHATHVSPRAGKIQLQSEGCGIEFRRITIMPLK